MARKSFLTSGAKNWYGKPTFSQKKRVRAIKHYIRAVSDRGHTHILYGKPKTISVQERKKAITPLGISYKKKEVLGIVLGSVPPFFLSLDWPPGWHHLATFLQTTGEPTLGHQHRKVFTCLCLSKKINSNMLQKI